MSDISKLTNLVIKFRDKRNWKKFHNPKDLVISLVLESTEVLEHLQWKSDDEAIKYLKTALGRKAFGKELSDVFYWILLISHDYGINLGETFRAKMRINERKYPVKKSKGSAKKYTQL